MNRVLATRVLLYVAVAINAFCLAWWICHNNVDAAILHSVVGVVCGANGVAIDTSRDTEYEQHVENLIAYIKDLEA